MSSGRIVPFYTSDELHKPIYFYEGRFFLKRGGNAEELNGHVYWQWLPRPSPGFEGISSDAEQAMADFFDSEADLLVPTIELPAEVDTVPKPIDAPLLDLDNAPFAARYLRTVQSVNVGLPRNLHEVRFNLVNFWALDRGERVDEVDGYSVLQLEIDANPWFLRVQNVPLANVAIKSLGETGGFAFQHCSFERHDSGAFDFADADLLFRAVFLAFSFARGRLVAPALPVGFARDGTPRFAHWGSPLVDPWKPSTSWFPHHDRDALTELFPLVYAQIEDPFWSEVLSRCIRMYVSSNTPDPLDTAIPSAQMGLELLAWAVLVEQEDWLREADGRLSASGRLRLLLRWANISTEIPAELRKLRQLGVERDLDGPSALVWIRNRLVHVRTTEDSLSSNLLRDAWRLFTHYLELCILKVIGYEGQYVNRVVARYLGDSEPVPWAKTTDQH